MRETLDSFHLQVAHRGFASGTTAQAGAVPRDARLRASRACDGEFICFRLLAGAGKFSMGEKERPEGSFITFGAHSMPYLVNPGC